MYSVFGLVLILGIRYLIAQRKGGGAPDVVDRVLSLRGLVWVLLAVAWIVWAFYTLGTTLLLFSPGGPTPATFAMAAFRVAVLVVGALYLFTPWPILRALARQGRPKLVYWLGHLTLVFPMTGETRYGACLLALLALAHRGGATKEERDWVQARLAQGHCHFGTYATACAIHLMLRARAAADEGHHDEAKDLLYRARVMLGTVTYASKRVLSKHVFRVVYEILGLDDARQGRWGSLEIAPEKELTRLSYVLRGWARERLMDKPDMKLEERRRRLNSPIVDRLFARSCEMVAPKDKDEAWLRARKHFVTLLEGGSIGPRNAINMLAAFDALLHPKFEGTVLPESVRDDEELVRGVHDDISEALAAAIAREGAPLFAMPTYGPISARVYQKLESSLFGEMERALNATLARLQHVGRLDPFTEWSDASHLRSVYRRVEQTLGPNAAAQVYPHFAGVYTKLGVHLSEIFPRMRPLAHAVFACLHREAVRFEDAVNIKQQEHNMNVTAGVE